MPRLVLFNRPVNVGSDDFVFSGSFEVLLRIFGLMIILIEFGRYLLEEDCGTDHFVHTYLLGLIVFFLLTILVDVLLVRVSMRGTIVDDGPRRNIYTLLYSRLGVLLIEFLWTVYGTASIVLHMPQCESRPRVYWLACLAVAGGWITSVVQGIIVLTNVDFSHGKQQAVITTHDWEKRWKGLFCCIDPSENRHVFTTLSSLCMQLFKKEEELVASDILAGLILVYHKQHVTRRQLDVVDAPLLSSRLRSRPHKTAISPTVPRKAWMTFSQAAHYMKFALGSYGWPYFIGLNNPVLAACKLLPKLNFSKKEPPKHVVHDNEWLSNTAAFCIQTGLTVDDLVHVSFYNEIYAIPFFVSIDKDSKSVIVSIRGTLSFEDILTDLVVERAPVSYGGVQGYVHTGMLQSAKYIRNKLVTENILHDALQRAPDYQLVITGHSLGGGVAALLALELRPLYPELHCFAFAVPGELVSESLLRYTEEFICTVCLGYDIVPRLGLAEVIQLRIDILNAIKNCSLPKHQVIAGKLWTRVFGKVDLGYTSAQHSDPEKVRWFELYIHEEMMEKQKILSHCQPLLPPGQILHVLEKLDPYRAWNVMPEYFAEWTDCQTFREIVLSKQMIAHHFPDTLLYALQQLTQHEHGVNRKQI